MKRYRTSRRSLATSASLLTVAIICLGFATNVKVSTNQVSSSLKMKASAPVQATTIKVTAPVRQATSNIAVLSLADAQLYRAIFLAQKQKDWSTADTAIGYLTDKRLMGSVLANRYLNRGASADEYTAWLKEYKDLPEAETIYQAAQKLDNKQLTNIAFTKPSTPNTWNVGYAIDRAADFNALVSAGNPPSGTNARKLARSINGALNHGDPKKARNLLIAAEAKHALTGTFAADAKAAIGAGFFYSGEREQAQALTNAAATANQPLGMWISGLIAWESGDMKNASAYFTKLSQHPALNASGRTAAHFWNYRALMAKDNNRQAEHELAEAAKQPGSFYGLLAAYMAGKAPMAEAAQTKDLPVWNEQQQAILAASDAGWRALALLQAGEVTLAESQLRRLNPQGRPALQQAMLALAGYVPMPALAMQLASLNGPTNGQSYDAALYPLLPWKPKQGFQIDRALLFALARHESQFDPTAVSNRGASGLMQIMPATAMVMADTDAEAKALTTSSILFDPTYNLELGQKYVQHLTERPQIGTNLMLLLAAYNGGPGKVARWMQGKAAQDPLLFMESIPQRETRNYLARVLPHYWAYRARLGKSLTSLTQITHNEWPQISLNEETGMRRADADDAQTFRFASN